MSALSARDKGFLHLILRSPDLGDGWRRVSDMVWPLVEKFPHQELIETRQSEVRLSEKGVTVAGYLT